MALSQDEINKRFGKHPAAIEGPNPNEPAHALLREAYVSFVDLLNQLLPDSRDTSLSLTALEESSMWAHKAVGRESYEVVDIGGPLTFAQELVNLINKHSLERVYNNTADWILGEFLLSALRDFGRAMDDVDEGLDSAVVNYSVSAVRTLDMGIRLRKEQNNGRDNLSEEALESIRLAQKESDQKWLSLQEFKEQIGIKKVPLVDQTGEIPEVVGEVSVVEDYDGYHIVGLMDKNPQAFSVINNDHKAPAAFSIAEEPKPGMAGLLDHFGLDASRYNISGNES